VVEDVLAWNILPENILAVEDGSGKESLLV
jgi:hypothetical protein